MENSVENITEIDKLVKSNTILMVSKDTIEETKDWLRNLYKVIPYKYGNVEEKIQNIINDCISGWGETTPTTFEKRLKVKVGGAVYAKYNNILARRRELSLLGLSEEEINDQLSLLNKGTKNTKKRRKKMSSAEIYLESQVIANSEKNTLRSYLNKEEKDYWMQRELEYRKEFDFNTSSDKVLLEEVIYNEVLIRRIRIAKMTGDIEKLEQIKSLKEDLILENHRKILEKLGVLRIQRIETDTNIEGNVSEISVLLEDKLNELRNITDTTTRKKTINRILSKYQYLTLEEIEDIIEEQSLLKEVERMGEINPIPQAVYEQVEMQLQSRSEKDIVDVIEE